MNKSILYLCLLFSFLLLWLTAMLYQYQQQDIVLEKNGLQFVAVDRAKIPKPHSRDLVFIAQELATSKKQLYRFSKSESNDLHHFFCYPLTEDSPSFDELFVQAISGKLKFEAQLCTLSTEDLIQIVTTQEIVARQLLQQRMEPGFFGFLDDSPLIFLVIAFLLFLLLWLLDGIVLVLQFLFNQNLAVLVKAIGLLLLGWVLSKTVPVWYPFSFLGNVLRLVIFLLPSFILFQYLNPNYFRKFSFPDGELFKFLCLFLGTSSFLFLGNYLGQWFDQQNTPVVLTARNNMLEIGFILSLSLGNLLNNVRKQLRFIYQQGKLLQKSEQQTLASQAALEALQASVNPHFLYNALNAIAGLATQDGEKTKKMALALSSFYQYITNKTNQQVSSLADELALIDNYLAIEKIRFEEQLQISLRIDPAAQTSQLPRFILQPIVENAIKYGFHQNKIAVRIEAQLVQSNLIIKVFDGGKAFDDQLSQGHGLQSVAKKLRYSYPDRHQLAFINTPEKHVYLQIQQN
ncbi:MAG: sensor histidine kinase [Saprospiraceae bacterium]